MRCARDWQTAWERGYYLPTSCLEDVIPSRALFQRAWALLVATHGGNCDNNIIACLITVIPLYSIPFHSISRSIDSGMPFIGPLKASQCAYNVTACFLSVL